MQNCRSNDGHYVNAWNRDNRANGMWMRSMKRKRSLKPMAPYILPYKVRVNEKRRYSPFGVNEKRRYSPKGKRSLNPFSLYDLRP